MDCWRGRPGMGRRSRSSKPSNNRLELTRSAPARNRGPRSSTRALGVDDMTTRAVPTWLVQVAWFLAGICATGAFWYFLSQKDYTWTFLAGLGALVFAGVAVYLHMQVGPSGLGDVGIEDRVRHREQLAAFLTEAQQLRTRLAEVPLPIEDHNEWVGRVGAYLRGNLGKAYEVRFGDFSGMTFYGDGSERSTMSRSIEGRSRRLNEFISELSR